MSGSLTDYGETETIKGLFYAANTLTAPANYYLAACTGVTDAGVITGEPTSDAAYARQTIPCSTLGWDYTQVAGTTKMANHAVVTFPEATQSWGSISYVALCDSATPGQGNVVAYILLDLAKTIETNDILRIVAGAIYFTLD